MARTTPLVEHMRLAPTDHDSAAIVVGTPAWFTWLEAATIFAFRGEHGSFTARKERSGRAGVYWKAYRKQDSRLRRAYLGKGTDLTPDNLLAAAAQLSGRLAPTMPPPFATLDARPPLVLGRALDDVRMDLLTTKLFVPHARVALVARPRLLARLEAGRSGLLTLVSAPAGWGKTTVLMEWLGRQAPSDTADLYVGSVAQHAPRPAGDVAWLSLDAGDNEPYQFLHYLVAAFQTVTAAIGATTIALLAAPQPPPITALLILLVNDLTTLARPCILVLDDYHVLTAPPIHAAVAFLLDHLPSQAHLVIATREDPPLPLARLRARGELSELRAADLRFSADEAAAFLTDSMALPLTADDVAVLETRTEGWIVGLQLAALAMRDRTDLPSFISAFTGSNRFVVDYLAQEVFDRQPSQIQAFLLQTSILDRLCGPLCDAVLGLTTVRSPADPMFVDGESGLILDQLERANLFIVALDDERCWYRYHHLFAEVLRSRLRHDATGNEEALLHVRASHWYEEQGLIDEAVRSALHAFDTERAAALIERYAMAMVLRSSDVLLVRTWVEQVPHALILARPQLVLVAAAVLTFTGQLAAAERLLAEAAPALRAPELAPTIIGELAALRATITRFRGDAASTLALARQALDLLAPDNHVYRAGVALDSGVAYIARGELAAARVALAEAAALGEEAGSPWIALAALEELGSLQGRLGQLWQTLRTSEQAVQLVSRLGGRPMPAAGMGHVGIAEVLYEWNDLTGAAHAVALGLKLLRGSVERGLLVRGYIALARIHQARGEPGAALASIHGCEEWFAQTQVAASSALAWLAAHRARLWVREGNLAAAGRWAQECQGAGDGELEYVQQLTLVRLRLAQRHDPIGAQYLREASDILTPLLPTAEMRGWTRYQIEIVLLQALVCQARGDITGALQGLEHALVLGQPEGFVRIFVDEGTPLGELLARGLADRRWGIGRGERRPSLRLYAQTLLAILRGLATAVQVSAVTPPTTPIIASRAPMVPALLPLGERLSEREMEVLRLVAAGLSNQAIAQQLVVAVSTVKKHLNNIYAKLDIQNRTHAIVRARELRLL